MATKKAEKKPSKAMSRPNTARKRRKEKDESPTAVRLATAVPSVFPKLLVGLLNAAGESLKTRTRLVNCVKRGLKEEGVLQAALQEAETAWEMADILRKAAIVGGLQQVQEHILEQFLRAIETADREVAADQDA